MGQYYRAVFLNKTKRKVLGKVVSYEFGNGAKLMEHSWMKNDFVGFVEGMLLAEPRPIVWAGDYADEEPNTEENIYTMSRLAPKITHDVDFEEGESKHNTDFKTVLPARFKYLINYDKKQFVNKSKVPNLDGWRIHPLPLLTCEGNGRCGGDFRGDSELVGAWARDVIGVESRKSDIPTGFTELVFDLSE